MQYIRIGKGSAERVKRKLISSKLLDTGARIEHSDSYVYFPTLDISKTTIKKVIGSAADIVERHGSRQEPNTGFRERLAQALTKQEYDAAPKGYDLLGNIAIVDIPEGLSKKEKKIAEIILSIHPSVETVLAKAGAVSGKFRVRKFRHILGRRNFTAAYKENNCTFVFDVRKSFFSNRLSFERARISSLVNKKENVAVFFAGIGPFAIEIARAHPDSNVLAIELNRHAYDSMLRNVQLNRTFNVIPVLGDVRKVAKSREGFADRIVMPLPHDSLEFLDDAVAVAKKKAVIHIYYFGKTESVFSYVATAVKAHARKNHYKARVLSKRIARPYSAKETEAVLDVAIEKQ